MSPRIWPPALDWRASTHWDYDAAAMDAPRPCVLCGHPSLLLSDDGAPCHKTCAEAWFEQHPDAWAAYEARRDRTTSVTPTTNPQAIETDNALFDQAA
ncbi:hypothetical protein ACWD4F_41900 [Streptomyces aureus]